MLLMLMMLMLMLLEKTATHIIYCDTPRNSCNVPRHACRELNAARHCASVQGFLA
jgi:hypothetical protein